MTIDSLYDAVKSGLEQDSALVVQEQITGEEVRFVIIKQRLRAAILRKRPAVTGDGVSTIEQLLKNENDVRRTITDTMVTYPSLDISMCDKGDVC